MSKPKSHFQPCNVQLVDVPPLPDSMLTTHRRVPPVGAQPWFLSATISSSVWN